MNRRLSRRVAPAVFLFLAILVIGVNTADATHFLGGKLTWKQDFTHPNPNEAKIVVTFQAHWRWSYQSWNPPFPQLNSLVGGVFYDIVLTTAQGQSTSFPLQQTVVALNGDEDWFTGEYEFSVIYPLSAFPLTAIHQSSARSSALVEGNNDANWKLATVIDLDKGTRSPDSTLLPRIFLEQESPATFQIPNAAFDNDTNVFLIAPSIDSFLPMARPVGTAACSANLAMCQAQCAVEPLINGICVDALRVSPGGLVTWTPQLAGLYAVQFKITGYDSNGNPGTSMPLDTLIQVQAACPTCPKVLVSAPATANGVAGLPLTFNVTTTLLNFPAGEPSLTSTALPAGATLGPLSNLTSPLVSTFTWTPAAPGDSFVCFQGNEVISGQASFGQACTTITVVSDQTPPVIAAHGNETAEAQSSAGAMVTYLSPSYSDDVSPAGTALCSPASGFLFPLGTNPVSCTATDAAGNSSNSSFNVIVVDTIAPVVTYAGNAGPYDVTQTVNITCAATDAVAVVSSTCAPVSGPAYSFGLGPHAFSATASDAAGNTGNGSTTFTVVATLQSLQQLVTAFCDNPGVCNGLNAKLNAAANANNANARAGQLGAFTNQVNAQTGKCLTAAEAAILLQLVQAFY